MAPLLSQNGLRSNIASGAILGQKQSHSSYMARGILHRSERVTSSCSRARPYITTPTGSIPNARNETSEILWL